MLTQESPPALRPAKIKVALIEDSGSYAHSLRSLISTFPDLCDLCHFSSIGSARQWVRSLEPDVVLLDILLPDGSGINFLPELKALLPHASLVVLTTFEDEDLKAEAARYGATYFLSKRDGSDRIIDSIRLCQNAGSNSMAAVVADVLEQFRVRSFRQPLLPRLTRAEKALLLGLKDGLVLKDFDPVNCQTETEARRLLQSAFGKLAVRKQSSALLALFGFRTTPSYLPQTWEPPDGAKG